MATEATQALIDSDVPTSNMTALIWRGVRPVGDFGARPLWDGIAHTQQAAEDYYASLSDQERRAEAAEILAMGGWTRGKIWMAFA